MPQETAAKLKRSKPIQCTWCKEFVYAKWIQRHFREECHGKPDLSSSQKICSRCQKVRNLSDFCRHAISRDSLSHICKQCNVDTTRKWYENKFGVTKQRKSLRRPGRWVLKPCKFCGEMFSVRRLLRHQPRCPEKPTKDPRTLRTKMTVDIPDGMADIKAKHLTQHKRRAKSNLLKLFYGIDVDAFEKMLREQKGLCAICGQPPKGTARQNHTLHVDHDHETGKIRALLCNDCNIALGAFKDNPVVLFKALLYLVHHKPSTHIT